MKKVIIVGAGLAGLSCAIELLEQGIVPIVLEANSFVGGRTASWTEAGMEIETGLHRYLGFYRHLPNLLRKAGLKLTDVIFWEDAVEMRSPDGAKAVYHASVHRPLRTMASFLGNNNYLSRADKRELRRMFAYGLKDYFLKPNRLRNMSVDYYARKHGVGKQAHDRALIPMTEGIFFTPPKKYGAYNLLGLIGPYMSRLWRFRIGGFRGGMTEVMAEPLAEFTRSRGGEVLVDQRVAELVVRDGRIKGVRLATGELLEADWVVLASSLGTAQQLTLPWAAEPWCQKWHKLPSVPVVTLHLELTEPAMPIDRVTFGPNTIVSAFAEQSRTTFRRSKGRLSLILSPPPDFVDTPLDDMVAMVVVELARIGIDIKGKVTDARKVVLPMDFYSLEVGQDQLRPSQTTPVPGLTLAGDYTRQKYLGTMEGAVYSGKLAAGIVAGILR